MRKILVTGGSGFIGSKLISYLEDSLSTHENIIVNYDLKIGVDITEPIVDKNFDVVFHLAASKSVPKSEENPELFIRNNCLGTLNIIKSFPKARIINISSSSVNDVKSVYGATKLLAEQIAKSHENCLSVRLYNVFGEGYSSEAGVIQKFIQAKINKEAPVIFGDGTQSRDFTYVGDVVASLVDLGLYNGNGETGVMHLGYGSSISVNDLLFKVFGVDKRPAREFDILDSKAPYKMQLMPYGREKGLERTIQWFEDEAAKPRI